MPLELAGETYWTIAELMAKFPPKLRPSEATLRRYIRKGKLHAIKLGRGTIISGAAIRKLLAGTIPALRAPEVSAETPPTTHRRPAETRVSFRDALARDCKLRAAQHKRRLEHKRAKHTNHNR
jgi:hypothetical protein